MLDGSLNVIICWVAPNGIYYVMLPRSICGLYKIKGSKTTSCINLERRVMQKLSQIYT